MTSVPKRMAIFASKSDHCLLDVVCRVFETLVNSVDYIFGLVGDGIIRVTGGGHQE